MVPVTTNQYNSPLVFLLYIPITSLKIPADPRFQPALPVSAAPPVSAPPALSVTSYSSAGFEDECLAGVKPKHRSTGDSGDKKNIFHGDVGITHHQH